MRQVFKYPIPLEDHFELELPEVNRVLKVDVQLNRPMLWVLVDPTRKTEPSKFRLAGTGHEIADGDYNEYIGSFQLSGGSLIFHLFRIN